MNPKGRVLVIGAGVAGICAAKNAVEKGFAVTVFEQTDNVGGLWNYTDQTGVDENGVSTNYMYKDLRTNVPKEIMRFLDYDVAVKNKSFLDTDEVLAYLQSYANHFNIPALVQFKHQVIRVLPTKDKRWEVLVKDLKSGNYSTEIFEFVMVCNGQQTCPFWPEIKGQDLFKGRQRHSIDFRRKEEFKDKNVLIIGSGPSAIDIALLSTVCAKSVVFSNHMPLKPHLTFPDNMTLRPDVEEMTERGAIFKDQTTCEVDEILFATGFQYSFPFLSTDCGIYVEDNHIQPLYKQTINIRRTSMAILGTVSFVTFHMQVDLQCRFALKMWAEGSKFPSAEEMLKDSEEEMEKRLKLGWKKSHAHRMEEFMEKNFQDLSELSGTPMVPKVYLEIYKRNNCGLLGGFMDYRKEMYHVIDDENFEVTQAPTSDD